MVRFNAFPLACQHNLGVPVCQFVSAFICSFFTAFCTAHCALDLARAAPQKCSALVVEVARILVSNTTSSDTEFRNIR